MPMPKPSMANAVQPKPHKTPELEAARQSVKKGELIRFGADVPADLQAQAMAKMKLERKTARELATKWLQQYVAGEWSGD